MATEIKIGFDLDRYPTLKRFAESPAKIRVVIGAAGSGKTSYCVMELLRLAMLQEPSPQDNVRYSMAVVVRNTYDLLIKSTVPTFKRMLGPLYRGKDSIPPVGQVTFPMADGTTVNLLINFMSVDSPEDEKKFLGFEPTFVFIDEVSECSESLIHAAVRRLGRYPSGALGKCSRSCLIAATNGPIEGHWLHHWWLGHEDEKHRQIARQMGIPVYAEIFKQPPALLRPLDPEGEWLPNPDAENVHNLADGYGYYYAMLGGSPESIAAYVEGDFASISTGRRVYREFNTQMHVAADRVLRPNQPYYYLLSFDFGRTPTCLLGTVTPEGSLFILDEFMGEDISVSQLWDETVSPALRRHYKGWMCEDATGDPAGMIEDQTTPLSPYKVLVQKGVPIRPVVNNNKYEARHNAVRYWLTQLNSSGKPKLQISDKCRFLVDALNRTYIYEKVRGQVDVFKEQPTKSHVNWTSDLCFTGDTLVLTMTGNKPIKDVVVGDKVLTRKGWRAVLMSGMTSPCALVRAYYIGCRVLEATDGHPVFVDNEFTPIENLPDYGTYCVASFTENETSGDIRVEAMKRERGRERYAPVFNLTVEGENEFFANGILVHNCDSFQYMCLLAISITANINQSNTYTDKPQQTESTWLG